jgi:hypothetical protein
MLLLIHLLTYLFRYKIWFIVIISGNIFSDTCL